METPEKTRKPTRSTTLLLDPEVKRWHTDLCRGSDSTAESYLQNLGRFLDACRLTPQAFVELPQRERENLLIDRISALEAKKRAGSYAKLTEAAVRSWCKWNGCRIERRIKIRGIRQRPTLKNEYIPPAEELHATLSAGTTTSRLATGLIAFSGIRPEVMGNRRGTDGLVFRDLPETHFEGQGKDQRIVFDCIPTLIHVREELSKCKNAWDTFLGPQGCQLLAAEVQARVAAGEVLGPDSAVITPRNLSKAFIQSDSVSFLIRRAMRAAGLHLRPYVWRCYFDNRLGMVDPGKLSGRFQEYLMGHSNLELRYMLGGKPLPPDMKEKMRKGYEAALKFLETTAPIPVEDPALGIIRLVLEAAGMSPEEIKALDLSAMTQDEILALLRRNFKQQTAQAAPVQRIVSAHELPDLLAQGWLYRAPLPDGKLIVEGGSAAAPA